MRNFYKKSAKKCKIKLSLHVKAAVITAVGSLKLQVMTEFVNACVLICYMPVCWHRV